jgi:hypothetical protein
VEDIVLAISSSGPLAQVIADVLVKDQNGNAAEGATVEVA